MDLEEFGFQKLIFWFSMTDRKTYSTLWWPSQTWTSNWSKEN